MNNLYESVIHAISKGINHILNESFDEEKQMIICAFPAMGKTYFMQHHKNAVDYDLGFFKYKRTDKNIFNPTFDNVKHVTVKKKINGKMMDVWDDDPDFPQNFIDAINENPNNIKYFFAAVDKDIINALEKNHMEYIIILPKPYKGKLPASYIKRYHKRFKEDPEYEPIKNNKEAQNDFIKSMEEYYDDLLRRIKTKKLKYCKKILYADADEYISDLVTKLK